ncbi:sialidase family protein [Flavobacterium sp. WC2509]|uniref:sialidase family protein n=1 Tax=Flavobacterium sp. WC2509 TaxID=3461406 RepID=UPI0040444FF2
MKKIILAVLSAFLVISCTFQEDNQVSEEELKINSLVPLDENSSYYFTDLVYFKNVWYLTFRESDKHVFGKDGVIHLYSRGNYENWKLIKTFIVDSIDLRDPKFSVNGDQLMLYIHGSKYSNKELLGFYDYRAVCVNKHNWSDLKSVKLDNLKKVDKPIPGNESWPWRVTWYKYIAYTFGYNFMVGAEVFDMYESKDGLNFKALNSVQNLSPNRGETTIRVDQDGVFYAIIREKNLLLAKSTDNNKTWQIFDRIPIYSFGGPNFLLYKNKMLITGRDDTNINTKVRKVVLYSYDLETKTYSKLLTLASGGDCGYAGMVIKDGYLWLSYYSSHESPKLDHSNVYVQKLNLSEYGL